jgi:hypothetical protein
MIGRESVCRTVQGLSWLSLCALAVVLQCYRSTPLTGSNLFWSPYARTDVNRLISPSPRISGLIGQRQMVVLAFVIANEPCSQGDVSRHFANASSSYQPRFRELKDAGVIEQRRTKVDPATGRVVKAYVATGKIPTEPIRRKRRKFRATLEPAGDGVLRVRQSRGRTRHHDWQYSPGPLRNPRSTMQKKRRTGRSKDLAEAIPQLWKTAVLSN